MPPLEEVCGHRAAHVAQSEKSDPHGLLREKSRLACRVLRPRALRRGHPHSDDLPIRIPVVTNTRDSDDHARSHDRGTTAVQRRPCRV
jgi:hypothetical protein